MNPSQPNPRFAQYVEEYDGEGKAIGFRLEGCSFFFKYDEDGGWKDENGNYYNSDGVELQKEEDWGDEDEVDQMEEELMEIEGDEESEPENQEKETNQQLKVSKQEIKKIEVDEAIKSVLQKLKGTESKVRIYIKSRAKVAFAKLQIKGNDQVERRVSIAQNLQVLYGQEKKKLLESLPNDSQIDFSVQDGKRYWFGFTNVAIEQFSKIIEELKTNENFGVLKNRTLLHLEIRLNIITSEKKATTLVQTINQFGKQDKVVVNLKNLSADSPLSFVLDLAQQVGVTIKQIYQVEFHSATLAKVWTNVNSAISLSKLNGLSQEQNILEVSVELSKQQLIEGNVLIITMKKKKQFNPIDILESQLLIPNTKEGYLKFSPLSEDKREIHVGYPSVKRLLKYRGSNMLVPVSLKAYKL